jgi:hypothetical protein
MLRVIIAALVLALSYPAAAQRGGPPKPPNYSFERPGSDMTIRPKGVEKTELPEGNKPDCDGGSGRDCAEQKRRQEKLHKAVECEGLLPGHCQKLQELMRSLK